MIIKKVSTIISKNKSNLLKFTPMSSFLVFKKVYFGKISSTKCARQCLKKTIFKYY